ncbi:MULTISPECIES: universal stress protein [Maritimibacter]|jgi:nucleotide-binding universal stress UspA family protein|uniref:Universal stress protein (Usp) n=1 Tax=Maritimibacter alkaliphilus HTCC2654 TaxID=314271 RepID=A3VDI0_9RHOB|nr:MULTISPECIES: universal stress protein [Maritimibacter]EAQ13569.1 Universal stress protein (Usp) [Maritimibacter alkaliphilus HTCC2654]MBL6425938.1 universal stress protein [Maritimibacter sp.]TYP83410.1 nucleotide-binding universal stress UspA family protein [Maritimibacter alkaliphilus HTCC2654]
MFKHIMAPVDLGHLEGLEHALKVTADLAKLYDCDVTYVAVGASTPGSLGHNPEEFAQKLGEFAASQGELHGVRTKHHAMTSHDPTTEMDDALLKAVDETGADLVVMQSHVPGLMDYIWPSNGGKIAGHAKVSVMVVRGA